MLSDIDRKFMTLFMGRTDAWGTEEGSCRHEPVLDTNWYAHLHGSLPLGIYPILPDGTVRWGCVDLDVRKPGKRRWDYDTEIDANVAAFNLQAVLRVLGIYGWVEVTRSGGRHVWVFAANPVPARVMRRALLVACDIAGVPPTEVNPKSEGFDDPTTLGNYVRLPYPHRGFGRYMLSSLEGHLWEYDDFVEQAWLHVTRTKVLEDAASKYREPKRERVEIGDIGEFDERIARLLSRHTLTVVLNGPLREDEDRSGWLYYVARKCQDDGLSPEDAAAVLEWCDATHTQKFVNRKDGERMLTRTVERAYS